MNRSLTINCDGGSRGNPGPAASAFVVHEGQKEVFSQGKFIGAATNNVAEYSAVMFALDWLLINKFTNQPINFILDSELVVRQLTGKYKIKNKSLLEMAGKIKKMEKDFDGNIVYTHVGRSKNAKADLIVNQTLDKNP